MRAVRLRSRIDELFLRFTGDREIIINELRMGSPRARAICPACVPQDKLRPPCFAAFT